MEGASSHFCDMKPIFHENGALDIESSKKTAIRLRLRQAHELVGMVVRMVCHKMAVGSGDVQVEGTLSNCG